MMAAAHNDRSETLKEVLLVDEVDNMLIDKGLQSCLLQRPTLGFECLN